MTAAIITGFVCISLGFVCGAMWAAMRLEPMRDIDWEDAA